MAYQSVHLSDSIHIEDIVTIHYFEYMNDFTFPGESHDFWEFLYVDKGETGVVAGDTSLTLKKGTIIFHKPNEFHSVHALGTTAPSLAVVSFYCDSPAMKFFEDKILNVDAMERNLLADIVIEARSCFMDRLDDPYQTQMRLCEPDDFGAEQMILLHLEHLLIHLIRRYSTPIVVRKKKPPVPPKTTRSRSDAEVFNRIADYLEKNIQNHITIDQICRENLIGRSRLQKIFQDHSGGGVIEYFSNMKIGAARQMIRDSHFNFTQISEQLGYTSVHYFSRQFKKVTGMTPTEYASSIQAIGR